MEKDNRNQFTYANARILWKNTEDESEIMTFKKVPYGTETENEEDDEDVFFYVNSWEEFDQINENNEDFTITKVLEYFN